MSAETKEVKCPTCGADELGGEFLCSCDTVVSFPEKLIDDVQLGRLQQHFAQTIMAASMGNSWLFEKRLRHALEIAEVPFVARDAEYRLEYLRPADLLAALAIPAAKFVELFKAVRESATWHPPITVDEDGFDVIKRSLTPTQIKLTDPRKIPPRDWLYGRHYIRAKVAADIAPGGGGKTIHVMTEAVSMASRIDILKTGAMYWRPLKVWYVNLEEDQDELDRRLAAIIKYYSESHTDDFPDSSIKEGAPLTAVSLALLKQNLWVDSSATLGQAFKFAEYESDGKCRIVEPLVEQVLAVILKHGIDLLVVDPFISSHSVGENDNVAIDRLIKDAYKVIAERGACGAGVSHHTRKPKDGREFTADDARGASALIDAVRTARVYNPMTAEDAKEFGVGADIREQFSRLSNGKPNYQKRGTPSIWRQMVTERLENKDEHDREDEIGVPVAWSAPIKTAEQVESDQEKLRIDILALIDSGQRITKHSGGDFTVKKLAEKWNASKKAIEAILEKLTEADEIFYADTARGYHARSGYRRVASKPKAKGKASKPKPKAVPA